MESDQLHVPASFFNFRYGMWLTQEPPRRFSVVSGPSSELQCQQVSIHCTVFAIWIIADFVRWNSCLLQGQRKNSSILVFLPCHPTFACQTLLDCLCTFDAFHISNSIRYFWASVCVSLSANSYVFNSCHVYDYVLYMYVLTDLIYYPVLCMCIMYCIIYYAMYMYPNLYPNWPDSWIFHR